MLTPQNQAQLAHLFRVESARKSNQDQKHAGATLVNGRWIESSLFDISRRLERSAFADGHRGDPFVVAGPPQAPKPPPVTFPPPVPWGVPKPAPVPAPKPGCGGCGGGKPS